MIVTFDRQGRIEATPANLYYVLRENRGACPPLALDEHGLTELRLWLGVHKFAPVDKKTLRDVVSLMISEGLRATFVVRIAAPVNAAHREAFDAHMRACVDAFVMQNRLGVDDFKIV